MPIPKPKKGEGEKDFISRCMSAIGDEYKDKDQAVAVCYQSWKDKSKPKANGAVVLAANIDPDLVREEVLEGTAYKVAPVVMAVEGVMNDIFYPAEELGKFVSSWDGRPVTLYHPKDEQGEFISANSPSVAERTKLGQLYHTRFEEETLKSEVWINIPKTSRVRPEVLEYLGGTKDRLEVSTGLWGEVEKNPGEFNGTKYSYVMRNIRPDHLALLPGGEGACSWKDGCGLRANENAEDLLVVNDGDESFSCLDEEIVIDYLNAKKVRKGKAGKTTFRESDHPRDKGGKFKDKGASGKKHPKEYDYDMIGKTGSGGGKVVSIHGTRHVEYHEHGQPTKADPGTIAYKQAKARTYLIVRTEDGRHEAWADTRSMAKAIAESQHDFRHRDVIKNSIEVNITNIELVNLLVEALPSDSYLVEIELTKKEVIYEQYTRSTGTDGIPSSPSEGKLFRRGYTIDNGEATLSDGPVEVTRVVSYKPVSNEGDKMTKKEKIEALIKDPRTRFEAGCNDFLNGLNEDQLDRLMPPDNVVIKEEKPESNLQKVVDEEFKKAITGNQEDKKGKPKPCTAAEWLATQEQMPKEVRDSILEGIALNTMQRTEIIESISKDPRNTFTNEQLQAKPTSELKALAAFVKPLKEGGESTGFFGMRATPSANENKDQGPEPLLVPDLAEIFQKNHNSK